MNALRCKRIYDPPEETDGFRVLVDRLWPRGVSRDAARIDLWAKDIAPSSALRKWFGHDPARGEEFAALYTAELEQNPAAGDVCSAIRERLRTGNVTLLYAAKDNARNHAAVLRTWMKEKI